MIPFIMRGFCFSKKLVLFIRNNIEKVIKHFKGILERASYETQETINASGTYIGVTAACRYLIYVVRNISDRQLKKQQNY